jgi:hypothetical protein
MPGPVELAWSVGGRTSKVGLTETGVRQGPTTRLLALRSFAQKLVRNTLVRCIDTFQNPSPKSPRF